MLALSGRSSASYHPGKPNPNLEACDEGHRGGTSRDQLDAAGVKNGNLSHPGTSAGLAPPTPAHTLHCDCLTQVGSWVLADSTRESRVLGGSCPRPSPGRLSASHPLLGLTGVREQNREKGYSFFCVFFFSGSCRRGGA